MDDNDGTYLTDDAELCPVRSATVVLSYAPDDARRMEKRNNVKTSEKNNFSRISTIWKRGSVDKGVVFQRRSIRSGSISVRDKPNNG